MTKKDLKKFEHLLLEQRERIVRSLEGFQNHTTLEEVVDPREEGADLADVGSDAAEQETAVTLASFDAAQLQAIDEALQRIKAGTYGVCEICNKEIPKKRLEIVPYARYCVQCQSEMEKSSRSYS